MKLDILIALTILLPAFFGLKSGFLTKLFSFLSFSVALFISAKFNTEISNFINSVIKLPLNVAGFMIFSAVFFIVNTIGLMIARKLRWYSPLTRSMDSSLGFIFGALQGILIASLLLIFAGSFNLIPKEWIAGSKLHEIAVGFAPSIFDTIAQIFPKSKTFFDELKFTK